jgi:hypothetical protein
MHTSHKIERIDNRLPEVEAILPLLVHRIAMHEQERAEDLKLVSDIRSRLTSIETDLAWMREHCVSRDDLERAINKLIWKMYGFGSALVALVYFIARNVH